MCDAQQKKAKLFGFDQVDDETCLWLKDFSQKILSIEFSEGWGKYFGKKGFIYILTHFFLKRIITYLGNYTFHQSRMIDTLSIGKAVLKQPKVDGPQIQKLFAKSDNASCYQGNYLPQALYQLCKE